VFGLQNNLDLPVERDWQPRVGRPDAQIDIEARRRNSGGARRMMRSRALAGALLLLI